MATPVLLLHGALGAKDQFESLTHKLQKFYEVHVLNFTGHGGGDVDGVNYSTDLFVTDVEDYLEGQNLPGIHIFGYSMGGYVALRFAQKYPEKAYSVTTLGTKFHWTPETARSEIKMLDPGNMLSKVPEYAAMLAKRHLPADWKRVVELTAEMMMDLGNGAAIKEADLKQIKTRVVLGIGSEDKMVSIEETKWAHKALPNAVLMTLEGVQHPIERLRFETMRDLIQTAVNLR